MKKFLLCCLLVFFSIGLYNDSAAQTVIDVNEQTCVITVTLNKEFCMVPSEELAKLRRALRKRIAELEDLLNQGVRNWIRGNILRWDMPRITQRWRDELARHRDRLENLERATFGKYIEPFITEQDMQDTVARWKNDIEKIWNMPGYDYDCCKVRFVVNTIYRDDYQDFLQNPTGGFDQIAVIISRKFRSRVGGFVTGFDNDGFSQDPYNNDMWGEWRLFTDDWFTAAHEAGHEMGLGDQYEDAIENGRKVSKPKTGHKNDIMAEHGGRPVSVNENGDKVDNIRKILEKRGIACPAHCCTRRDIIRRKKRGDVIILPKPKDAVSTQEPAEVCEGLKPEDATVPADTTTDTADVAEVAEEQVDVAEDIEVVREEGVIIEEEPVEETGEEEDYLEEPPKEDAAQTAEEGIQYKKITEGDVTCDTGILYKKTPDGMDIEITALPTGEGIDFRNWEVTDIKIKVDEELIRAEEKENFYVSKESVFRDAAVLVFVALGSQYEQYADEAETTEQVCPVTGQRTTTTTERERGKVAGAIDRAGMATGMGLLVSQSKGEITGRKYVFKLNKELAQKIDGENDEVRISLENKQKHQREKIKIPLARP